MKSLRIAKKLCISYDSSLKRKVNKNRKIFYDKYFDSKKKISKSNVDKLLNNFYNSINECINYIISFENTEQNIKFPKFDNELFEELLNLDTLIQTTLENQLINIKEFNFYKLNPSVFYLLIYNTIADIHNKCIIEDEDLEFDFEKFRNMSFMFVSSLNKRQPKGPKGPIIPPKHNANIKIVGIIKFMNLINENLCNQESEEYDRELIINKIKEKLIFMKSNRPTIYAEEGVIWNNPNIPIIKFFCCNSLYNNRLIDFGYKKEIFFF